MSLVFRVYSIKGLDKLRFYREFASLRAKSTFYFFFQFVPYYAVYKNLRSLRKS